MSQSVVTPAVERPDGVELHWEARGDGPLVLVVHQILRSYPHAYAELIGDLARDHRVATYDPRGSPGSVSASYGGAVAIAVGYGFNIAVRVAAARPELISHGETEPLFETHWPRVAERYPDAAIVQRVSRRARHM